MVDRSPQPPEARIAAPTRAEERDLARRVKEGDEGALERLLGIHWRDLVQYVLRFVRSQDQAEDIVQEAFVRLWSRRETWRRTDTLRPVLYRLVRNLALNERRRLTTFLEWARTRTAPDVDEGPSPFDEAVGSDLREAVRRAVEALPERRREIFVLVRFHSMTHAEAAHALELSPQTVANQVSQATADLREALAALLEEEGEPRDFKFSASKAG